MAAVCAAVAVAATGSNAGTGSPPRWLTTARAQFPKLAVHPAGPMSGYSRAAFGEPWADTDHNGCDTRDDILKRDLTHEVFKPSSTCIVASGILHDPYTGKTINFVRGVGTSSLVQIDHVVALADAWRTGASTWTAARRLRYANDRTVLLAVDGGANDQKGDDDASQWLPRPAYRCRYVAKQIAIKTKYHLWLTAPERSAIATVLDHCS